MAGQSSSNLGSVTCLNMVLWMGYVTKILTLDAMKPEANSRQSWTAQPSGGAIYLTFACCTLKNGLLGN